MSDTPTPDAIEIERELCEVLVKHVPVNDLPSAAILVVKLKAALRPSAPPASAPKLRFDIAQAAAEAITLGDIRALTEVRARVLDAIYKALDAEPPPTSGGFAGLPSSRQGFAGTPEHLQPSNLPASAQSCAPYQS